MGHRLVRALLIAGVPAVLLASSIGAQEVAPADDKDPASELLEAIGGDVGVDEAIGADELRGHVQALSHDALKGRPQGSFESMVAARYCAARLEAAGLAPGAADGTFLQRIDYERTVHSAAPELELLGADGAVLATLANGVGFTFAASGHPADIEGARCVYVADEESIPAEADPAIALVMETSARRARGWLETAGHGDGSGFALVLTRKKTRERDRDPVVPRTGRWRLAGAGSGRLSVSVTDKGAAALLGDRAAARLAFRSHAALETAVDANVVAVLEGGERRDEHVILCAHRDHVGTARMPEDAAPDRDVIYNGADDDASGCAVVLELAEALARAEAAPERTVVVVLVTGEERGFVGSRYWARHPTVPIDSVTCALNFEMLGRPDEYVGGAGNLWLTGDARSTLGPGLRALEIDVKADDGPRRGFFKRSDNVSFAEVGIVSQTLSSYNMHQDYHKVTDEWDTLDYAHMEVASALALRAVAALVNGELTPEWNEGEPDL